jgi:CTP:molybdopterin cytidylyltransferase MocA
MRWSMVLAAGQGTRMGFPKALLAWSVDGESLPLAVAHARVQRSVGIERVVLVVRRDVAHELARFSGPDVILCPSDEADALGPAGSIRCGASMAARWTDAPDGRVLLSPVDVVPPEPETLRALLARLDDERVLAARPRCHGRGGHPVAVRAEVLRAFLAGAPAAPPPLLRDVLRGLGPRCVDVPVDDEAVLTDLDDAGAVERARGVPAARFQDSPGPSR